MALSEAQLLRAKRVVHHFSEETGIALDNLEDGSSGPVSPVLAALATVNEDTVVPTIALVKDSWGNPADDAAIDDPSAAIYAALLLRHAVLYGQAAIDTVRFALPQASGLTADLDALYSHPVVEDAWKVVIQVLLSANTDDLYGSPLAACESLEDLTTLVGAPVIGSEEWEKEWEGDGVDSMLKRAASNVVARSRFRAPTTDFPTPRSLQQWLDECASSSPGKFEVAFTTRRPTLDYPLDPADFYALAKMNPIGDDVAAMLSAAEGTPPDGDDGRRWYPWPFNPVASPEAWMSDEGLAPPVSTIKAHFNGPTVVDFQDIMVADEGSLRPILHPANGPGGDESWDWYFVRIKGLDGWLIVPCREAVLSGEVDDDGATLSLSVASELRLEHNLRQRIPIESMWGHWFQEDLPLTDEELDEGVARAEALVRMAIADDAQRDGDHANNSDGGTDHE